MKFQIGDKVIVRHSEEEGEVIDIINDKMVMVEVKGVRFPAYADQIDFPYFKRFLEERKAQADPKPAKKTLDKVTPERLKKQALSQGAGSAAPSRLDPNTPAGVYLTFFPVFDKDIFDDDVVDYYKVYLVNQTPLDLHFQYWLRLGAATDMELSSTAHSFSDFYLQNIPLEKLNDNPRLDFDFSLVKPIKGKVEHFETSHKIKPKQVFQKTEALRQRQEASFSYRLFDAYPDEPYRESLDLSRLGNAGFKIYDAGKARQHLEPARSVIDLHAEKLSDQPERLAPDEILDLQLRTFEKYLELAVLHHLPGMIIIHGVGTGKLRDEIHQALNTKKEVKSFVNQYLPSYGYGATEVFFR